MPLLPLGKAPLGGGIPTYILGPLDKIKQFMNLHPSFWPIYKISDEETKERCSLALNYAAMGLGRPELTKLLYANRILFKQIYVKELGLLDCLLYQTLRGEYFGLDDEGNEVKMWVYSFDPKRFTQLNIILRRLLDSASPSFWLTGKKLPSLPTWGDIGDVGTNFLSENDFEIVAVAYCAQVEHFLTRLANVHDFLTGNIHNADDFTEDFAHIPSAITKTFHKQKPKQEKERGDVGDSISAIVRTERKAQFSSTKRSDSTSVPWSSHRQTQNMLPRTTRRLSDMWSEDDEAVADAGGDPDPGDGSSDDKDDGNRQPRHRQQPQPPSCSVSAINLNPKKEKI